MAAQTAIAITTATSSASGAGHLESNTSTAATAPVSPTPLPADRSMCPGRSTINMPSARIAVTLSSIESSDRLRADRNTGCLKAKKALIAISAITIEKLRREMRSDIVDPDQSAASAGDLTFNLPRAAASKRS